MLHGLKVFMTVWGFLILHSAGEAPAGKAVSKPALAALETPFKVMHWACFAQFCTVLLFAKVLSRDVK
jgi:hypothetical protein